MHRKTILSGEYNGITDHFAAKQLFAVSHIRAYLHEHRLCPKNSVNSNHWMDIIFYPTSSFGYTKKKKQWIDNNPMKKSGNIL